MIERRELGDLNFLLGVMIAFESLYLKGLTLYRSDCGFLSELLCLSDGDIQSQFCRWPLYISDCAPLAL